MWAEVIVYDPNRSDTKTVWEAKGMGSSSGEHNQNIVSGHRDAVEVNNALRITVTNNTFKAQGTMEMWRRLVQT